MVPGLSDGALASPPAWASGRVLALALHRVAGWDRGITLIAMASSLTCGYMAGTVLVVLLLNAILGWWWDGDVAALMFLLWLLGETREAMEEARGGRRGQPRGVPLGRGERHR